MPKNINITSMPAPKAAAAPQEYLFEGFCELLKRVFLALQDDGWAEDTCWDIAFGNSMSEAEAAWQLVSVQADDVLTASPLSTNDLVLHRMTRLLKRAVTAPDIAALNDVYTKIVAVRSNATSALAPAVMDLVQETEACIVEMYAHACEGGESQGSILPLAA